MKSGFIKNVTGLVVVATLLIALIITLTVCFKGKRLDPFPHSSAGNQVRAAMAPINAEFAGNWVSAAAPLIVHSAIILTLLRSSIYGTFGSTRCAPIWGGRDPSSQSVSEIATVHGFTHLGRFSAEYCDFFGELPSETLRH